MTSSPRDCGHQHEDGAYVLGALSPEDRLAFERHLPDCAPCDRSVREIAGIPGLLARVPAEILDPEQPSPAPDSLLPALLRRVRRDARRRAWVTGALSAAATAAVVAALGVATLGWSDADAPQGAPGAAPTTAEARPMRPLDPAVTGSVALTTVGWGTRLDLTCRYSDGEDGGSVYRDQPPPTYALFVTRTDGTTEQVASWRGVPDETMHLAAATAASTEDVASVEVRSSDGATVLELDS